MSEYYKSLISDNDVITELIKESQRREGKLPIQSCRLKPNLNFFQRTVNGLVSNNKRISKQVDSFKAVYAKLPKSKLKKQDRTILETSEKRSCSDYQTERRLVLQRSIKFVPASERQPNTVQYRKITKCSESTSLCSKNKDKNKKLIKRLYIHSSSSDSESEMCLSDKRKQNSMEKKFLDNKSTKQIFLNTNENNVIYVSSDESDLEK